MEHLIYFKYLNALVNDVLPHHTDIKFRSPKLS